MVAYVIPCGCCQEDTWWTADFFHEVPMATDVDRQRVLDRQWFIVGRWQEYEGEARANLLRAIGLAAFYAVELINYNGLRLGFLEMPQVVERPFHLAVTVLVLAWAMVVLGVLWCRKQGVFPASLKFVSTGCDLVLLTTIMALGDGPRSPLLVVYFLILALAALRFSLPLLWFATGGSLVAYLVLLGHARWFAATDLQAHEQTVPRFHQLIVVLGLTLTGVVLGQVVRRVRYLAEDYAQRVTPPSEGQP